MDLKSCPCCGGQVKIKGAGKYWLECTKCGLTTRVYDTMLDAIKAWNHREPDEDRIFLTRFEWILLMLGAAIGWLISMFVWG